MTVEEAIKIGKTRQECLRAQNDGRCKCNLIPNYCDKGCEYNTSDKEYDEFETLAIKALEQQPCEDWYDVPSDNMTLEQARQAVKDLRKMLPEYLEQNPNEDCIRRGEALMALTGDITDCTIEEFITRLRNKLSKLPSVTPKEKTGKWIENAPEYQNIDPPYICSECGNMHLRKTNYCDQCGARMVEPQESEDKE